MMRQLKIALLQLQANDRACFSNVSSKLLDTVLESIAAGAELIVFPEGTLPAYILGEEAIQAEEYQPTLNALLAITQKYQVVIVGGGVHFQTLNVPKPQNVAYVCQADGSLTTVAKRFLWHFDERWYTGGTQLDPIQTKFGKLGILVCADGRMPTYAATLVDRGAELLVMPTAWVTSGAQPQTLENVQADFMARLRARENGVPLIAANKVGVERGAVLYCGKSQVIDRDGGVLAIASATEPETLVYELRYDRPQPHRSIRRITTGTTAQLPSSTVRRIGIASQSSTDIFAVAEWSSLDLVFSMKPAAKADIIDKNFIHADISALARFTTHTVAGIAVTIITTAELADPHILAAWRSQGGLLVIVAAQRADYATTITTARLRAMELRLYIIVIDEDEGIYSSIIDPEGAVLAGTTREFHLAQAAFSPAKIAHTEIVPSTDIIAGLNLTETGRRNE